MLAVKKTVCWCVRRGLTTATQDGRGVTMARLLLHPFGPAKNVCGYVRAQEEDTSQVVAYADAKNPDGRWWQRNNNGREGRGVRAQRDNICQLALSFTMLAIPCHAALLWKIRFFYFLAISMASSSALQIMKNSFQICRRERREGFHVNKARRRPSRPLSLHFQTWLLREILLYFFLHVLLLRDSRIDPFSRYETVGTLGSEANFCVKTKILGCYGNRSGISYPKDPSLRSTSPDLKHAHRFYPPSVTFCPIGKQ